MKILNPICFRECSLSNYIMEIILLLVAIAVCLGFIIAIGWAIYSIWDFIKDKSKRKNEN